MDIRTQRKMMMMMMIGGNNQVTTQKEWSDGGGGSSAGGESGISLKKGPWTAVEDAVLAEYVRNHGEGSWNAVQKNTGLARCGKSCRLRWVNHLRPNLKKGAFSAEEERIIIELHAKIGNKWARMATKLPGRTDNEIKNYWNTRVKRRQRQGLPLYPPDIEPLYSQQHQKQQLHRHSQPPTPIPSPPTTTSTSCFSFQTPRSLHCSMPTSLHPLHIPRPSAPQNFLCNPRSAATPPPSLHSPSSASTQPPLPSPSRSTPPHVSLLQSPHKPAAFSTLPLFAYSKSRTTTVNNTATPSDDDFFRSYKRFRHDGSESNYNNNNDTCSSFMLPFSPLLKIAAFDSHTATVTNGLLTPPHYPPYSLDPITLDLASSSRILRPHFGSEQFISTPGLVYPFKTELPSNQLLPRDRISEVVVDTKGNNYGSNDGLLDNMLEEAQNNEITGRQSCLVGVSLISKCLASELKAKEETPEEMNSRQHGDNSRLLNDVPCSMPIPEWYEDSGENCDRQPLVITDDNLGLDTHHVASLFPVDIAPSHGRTSGVRYWDNFPGMC